VANLAGVSYPLENALFQWEEGWRAYQRLGRPADQRQADRVIGAIHDELRRRIGPTFRAAELATLYGEGTDWCQRAALDAVPRLELDPQTLADAAFWLYLRRAGDFAGGRELVR
jgi:hypothetical protein